jgi:3-hydroxyisobutyrate/3-hydroxypropionate dehydrogenase
MGSVAGSPDARYGFVGIGVMGYGMALNLRKKIPSLSRFVLCEINKDRRDQFVQDVRSQNLGAVDVVDTPKDVAENSDIVITMLPKAPHVLEVFKNPDTGFLAIDKPSKTKLFLECSSIDTASSVELSKVVEASGIGRMIDSPVSGGPQGSDAGTLTFMCGGPEELFQQAVPILSMMGKEDAIINCGAQGAGLATKQLNNYLGYIGYVGLCEVMATGVKYGLDPKTLSDVINKSSGMNWNSMHMNPVKGVHPNAPASRDFKGGFSVELAHGVIADATNLMDQVGTRKVLANDLKGIYDEALEDPRTKGQEARSVWRFFEDR